MAELTLQPTTPFLKWVGGKRQLLPEIKKRLPEGYNHYYEPFVGGGAVFLALQPKLFTINDYNEELTNTYTVIAHQLEELIEELKEFSLLNNKEDYMKIRRWDVENKLSKETPVRRAARTIYLNKTCFNGLYRVNQKGHFNAAFANNQSAKILDEANLRNINAYLNAATFTITQGDYKKVLELCEAGDFIYLDPPYASERIDGFVSYTNSAFGDKEQEELCDLLKDLDDRGCYWLYSNASVPLIHNLFKDYEATTAIVYATRKVNTKADGRGKVPEVLITNYPQKEALTLF